MKTEPLLYLQIFSLPLLTHIFDILTTFLFQPYKNRLFYFVNNLRYNKDSEKQLIKNVSL